MYKFRNRINEEKCSKLDENITGIQEEASALCSGAESQAEGEPFIEWTTKTTAREKLIAEKVC